MRVGKWWKNLHPTDFRKQDYFLFGFSFSFPRYFVNLKVEYKGVLSIFAFLLLMEV